MTSTKVKQGNSRKNKTKTNFSLGKFFMQANARLERKCNHAFKRGFSRETGSDRKSMKVGSVFGREWIVGEVGRSHDGA